MKYIDGFVVVVKKDKLKEYEKMAKEGAELWMKHGALQYFECMGDDLNPHQSEQEEMKPLTFPEMINLNEDETAWFSFIIYRDKSHRDEVNAKVMKEMEEKYKDSNDIDMPFDMKRMAHGGFKVIVEE